MSMTENLDKLLYSKNITKAQLSKESGIPYTTISGFYTKGTDNAKLSTLKKIS
ncbi:TPA: helix-turn-helix transcriptional regulator [Clostridioides difficile]|nr:helix-turn-helix transcriptional regulator [Clostridioides difficile]HBH1329004.1 helix-turn-helix transcriptional regulator [Clostridioides difficile]